MAGSLDTRRTATLVGRGDVLRRLDRVLDVDPSTRVVFVHGPGGIGKSAVLRELANRAQERSIRVVRIDGRDSDAAGERLQAALAAFTSGDVDSRGGLVLLDAYEHVTALGAILRDALSSPGSEGVRFAIASRRPPEPAWHQEGLDDQSYVVRLDPLDEAGARELAQRRGLADPDAIARLVSWAGGSPLALAVGADALLAGQILDPGRLDADATLATTLLDRLVGDELDGHDREVIAVAAIARAVDARLLAAVLPGVDAENAEAWLRGLSFAEPFGLRVTLHERVSKAVRGALLAYDPVLERDLRRRIADHLHARAVMGEARLSTDLAELISDERVRWGLAPPPIGHYAATVAAGDAAELGARLGAGGTDWWAGVERWFAEAREHVLVVRDATGRLAGFGISVTIESAPAWADEDAVLGPWLRDARERAPGRDALLIRDRVDLTDDGTATSPVASVGAHAIALRSGLASIRYMYAGLPDDAAAQAFVRSIGYRPVPELDAPDGERLVRCFVCDLGPNGTSGILRDAVYRDLGIASPPEAGPEEVAAELVRDALRAFRTPGALAASPLARGVTVDERAASMRRLLLGAVDGAFGDSAEEQLQRAVLRRGYVDDDGSHIIAQLELHLGRSVYFRRLADASECVAAYLRSKSL
jgi:hypothetical protein